MAMQRWHSALHLEKQQRQDSQVPKALNQQVPCHAKLANYRSRVRDVRCSTHLLKGSLASSSLSLSRSEILVSPIRVLGGFLERDDEDVEDEALLGC
jgi:hypothetical protein